MAHHRVALIALVAAAAALPCSVGARADAPAPPATSNTPSAAAAASLPATEAKLEWLTFDAATERAAKEKKHVIVDIYTTWCGWCKVMERQTYADPEVTSYLEKNFVLAKVNGESLNKMHWQGKELTERQFARVVGVTGYPATYFLKPDAELLGGVAGFIKKPDFMVYARFVGTRWYEKGSIQAYVDSLQAAGQ
ncbi:MAG: thioredoxin family protein [Hyphomicrobiales bacterium]